MAAQRPRRSWLNVAQHGQHPAVIGLRRRQADLAEDVPDVLRGGPPPAWWGVLPGGAAVLICWTVCDLRHGVQT